MKRCLPFVAMVWMITVAIPLTAKAETFLQKILRIAGISATPNQQKGPGDADGTGDVWMIDLHSRVRQRVTQGGGYRSPVFDTTGERLLALQGNAVIRVPVFGGEPQTLFTIARVFKLVGFSLDDPDTLLLLTEDAAGRLTAGLLSLRSGHVTALSHDKQSRRDRRLLSHLKGWERVYGNTTLYVKRETKQDMGSRVQWTDVYMKQEDEEPVNLSRCNGTVCGQPTLSPDGRRMAFIKVTGP